MSIYHKAFLFRYDDFEKELAETLYDSLQSREVGQLRNFINLYRASLTDEATEDLLAENWEEEYGRQPDVQQYADLALTKYYDLTDSLGLGEGFDALSEYLLIVPSLAGRAGGLICGMLFGPKGHRLDPGRMGTGLLSPAEAAGFAKLLAGAKWPIVPGPDDVIYSECLYAPESADEVQESLNRLMELYRTAAEMKSGILFVDFNDCGVSHM